MRDAGASPPRFPCGHPETSADGQPAVPRGRTRALEPWRAGDLEVLHVQAIPQCEVLTTSHARASRLPTPSQECHLADPVGRTLPWQPSTSPASRRCTAAPGQSKACIWRHGIRWRAPTCCGLTWVLPAAAGTAPGTPSHADLQCGPSRPLTRQPGSRATRTCGHWRGRGRACRPASPAEQQGALPQ